MILTSGKVVGNLNPVDNVNPLTVEWKEVRDNRHRKSTNQTAAGMELVPVNQHFVQQVQESGNSPQKNVVTVQEIVSANGNIQHNNDNGKRHIDPVDACQQFHTSNKFAALQLEEENNQGNQLAIINNNTGQNSNIHKELNPTAAIFTPKSIGVASSNKGSGAYRKWEGSSVNAAAVIVNSTTQVVKRTSQSQVLLQTSHAEKSHLNP